MMKLQNLEAETALRVSMDLMVRRKIYLPLPRTEPVMQPIDILNVTGH
jgi:hypothetical protein